MILKGNSFSKSDIDAISQAIQANLTLRHLDLCENKIGPNGAQALAAALHYNCTLETLLIGKNKILNVGAVAIGEVLKINKALKFLDISENGMTAAVGTTFAELFVSNTVFETLKINKECIPVIKRHSKLSFYYACFWKYVQTIFINLDSFNPIGCLYTEPRRYLICNDEPGDILSRVPLITMLFPDLFT